MKKHRLQSNFTFRLMSTKFRIRDWLRPPITILQEAGVRSGMTVLDFGCGPGGFSLAAARLVWPEGRVYVVDIHPLAVKSVQRAADKQGCNNIQTVFGGSLAEVPEGNVDIALLYDALHHLPEPDLTLLELRGVLRSKGVLSVSDHHLKEAPLRSIVTGSVHFRLIRSNRWTFQFEKTETSQVTT